MKPKRTPTRTQAARLVYVGLRCSPRYKAWLEAFVKRERVNASHLLDQALAQLAASRDFEAPPERGA